jgi:hypothetical protein
VPTPPDPTNNQGINVMHSITKRKALKMADLCLKHVRDKEDKSSFVNNRSKTGELEQILELG